VLTFVPPDGEGVGHVPVKPVEVLVGVVVGVVEEWHIFARELDPKPPPLDTGEVADQPVQAQRGRGDGAFRESSWRDAVAFRLERGPVPVEVGDRASVAQRFE
jgi:hypothetical protein